MARLTADPEHAAHAARITELEIALTHQQAMLDDLNSVVRDQAERIDRLLSRVDRLAGALVAAEDAQGAPPDPDARPPHW